ncbi:hypothetical protein THAOC_29711, partial [Thalassiosira oceanica]
NGRTSEGIVADERGAASVMPAAFDERVRERVTVQLILEIDVVGDIGDSAVKNTPRRHGHG